ncbi:MAG: RnfABCDGE type electron transport complex subunit D [Gammaproteobacteria bacterium]|nr:MAG: RnfABCDGE type electron transport complex subunit D [Gammaproteobacteria bacterium]
MTEAPAFSPPYLHAGANVPAIMREVALALVPGVIVYFFCFGWGVVLQCLLCMSYALAVEALLLRLLGKDVRLFLGDGSAAVTGLLFALCISPFTPWWTSLFGIAFALVCGKHLYGGLGRNPFNPAMVGYVFVLLSYPAETNRWPGPEIPNLAEYISIILRGEGSAIDAFSGASALNEMKSRLGDMQIVSEILTAPGFGHLAGRVTEWINLAFAAGGIYLILRGVIRWHIPAAVLAGMFISSAFLATLDSELHASPGFHLLAGGTMLGSFFIATDPVTSPETKNGCLLYGFLIGLLALLIRRYGAYPDGIAFAVLIANAAAPLLTRLTLPRLPGEVR